MAVTVAVAIGLNSCSSLGDNAPRHHTEEDLKQILASTPFEGAPLRILRSELIRKTLLEFKGLSTEMTAEPNACLDLALSNALACQPLIPSSSDTRATRHRVQLS